MVVYLRRNRRTKDESDYEYWSLVESVRTARGPRQRTVATIGKLPSLDHEERVGWEEIRRILHGRLSQPSFFEFEVPPSWANVDITRVSVERLRHFGDVYLGLLLWGKLGFAEFCKEHMREGKEEIPWSVMASILVIARFCAPSSELQIAEGWYEKTALDDLLGVPDGKINDDRLYRALDALLPHKDALSQHLQNRYGELFGTTFDFLFYDITSTYFEGTAEGNPQAKRGYSRDSRPDCPQVCIGLVATKEGLPAAFEIFDGNRSDVTTPREMIEVMEAKYGKARMWVMDRGMVSEKNLEFMRDSGARYLVSNITFLMNAGRKCNRASRSEFALHRREQRRPSFSAVPLDGRRRKTSFLIALSQTSKANSGNWLNGRLRANSRADKKWSGRSDGFWNGTVVPPLSSRLP